MLRYVAGRLLQAIIAVFGVLTTVFIVMRFSGDPTLLPAGTTTNQRGLGYARVVQGRLEGQAPDIDSVVYFTECDPSALTPGDLIQARVVAARGYDLVAIPVLY